MKKLTGEDIKRLVGECESLIPCESFFDELAGLINQEIKKPWSESGLLESSNEEKTSDAE